MPLITCPDCESEISDTAPTCPRCGRPTRRPAVQTIEQTGKPWKTAQLLFSLLTIGGCVTCVAGSGNQDALPTGMSLFFLGLVGFAAASLGAWWEHG